MRRFATRLTLARKLQLSYLLVVVVAATTLLIVGRAIGPSVLTAHMNQMMGQQTSGGMMGSSAGSMDTHTRAAFQDALMEALLIAVGVAALVALIVGALVARQVVQPLTHIVAATRRIAAGHYAERVPVGRGGASDELAQLATRFNDMADSLEQTERRRLALVGDVAHELRTPISTLEGYLEGLLDGVVAPSEATWAKLHAEAGRLRRLVDDLQELSRAEARQTPLTLRPVPAQRIAELALDRLVSQFADKGLALRQEVPSSLPSVLADEDRAVQVLTNVLTNALRYTPAAGNIVLRVERQGVMVAFSVADSGIGVAPEDLAHIFERFYRVDKSRSRALGGSGIGLTIAKALVEAMGGEMQAGSAGPGRGSTFTFTLPVARPG
jgi:signal transduction histidine kinase